MAALLKNPAIWVAISYTFLYFFSSVFVGPSEIKNIVDFGVLAIAGMFLASWIPTTLEALKSGGAERKYRLALGLALLAAGLLGQRVWVIIINQIGLHPWISREMVSGFVASWLAAGMLLCLSIDAKQEGLVPHLKIYYTGIIGGVCLVIGFLVAKLFFP